MENTLLGTWADTFGSDYLQIIDSDPRWTSLDGTSERKTWLLLLRVRAPIVTYVSLKNVCNGIVSLFNKKNYKFVNIPSISFSRNYVSDIKFVNSADF